MHSFSTRSRNLALAVVTAALVLSTAAPAQEQQEAEAASTAEPADQPRRARDRRRAEPPAELPVTQVQATQGTAVTEPVEAKLVCKTEKLTGTKIGRRVCATPEQWAARSRRTQEAAQETIQDIRDQSAFPAPPVVPIAIP